MASDITEVIQEYFGRFTLRKYQKGQIFIFPNEEATSVFCLKSGTIKQYVNSYRGDKVIVNVFTSPAYFPLATFVARTPNRYFFEAETPVEVYQAPAKDVMKFFQSDAEVVYHVLERLYISIDVVLGRMVQLMTGTAKSRIIYELLVESKRFGHTRYSPNGVIIALNERDLSARTGLSRETINRQLQKFKKAGLIEIKRGKVDVPDISLLERQLETNK